ncbi:thrombospondin type 3 repeat-containing protein [Solirubrobacter taibaiensis]|nr:thrombospondin type 3 repeat-containing protein [Solirubrobacter taibaiensis]
MPLQHRLGAGVAVALLVLAAAAPARADEPLFQVVPTDTDAAILDTPSPTPGTRGNHLVWLAPAERRVDKLAVFLPTGGPTNLPSEFKALGTEMGRLGYHTVLLAYRNEAPIAASPTAPIPGCGNLPDKESAPVNCAINARTELLTGVDPPADISPIVSVNRANGIENRLNKLLAYLVRTRPAAERWGQFVDGNGEPVWAKTVITGSSLGAGQVAIIAAQHAVDRAVMLHGWTDAKHEWVKYGATDSSKYFALIHARDNFFARTCFAYKELRLATVCPLAPVLIDNRTAPYGDQVHVFNLEPGSTMGTGDIFHQSTSRDGWIAREKDGSPSRVLVSAWRSVLGDKDADSYLDDRDNCPLVANADQTDSDGNKIGDACGPTLAQGTVGGAVPATLALTLGTPATFGAFVPGVTRTYDATTTASVISTAGDAALTVSAPGHLTNGAFSLPEPLRVTLTPASWTAPVSNAAVSVAFTQLVKATDPLRTGTYSKVLTFTLSTSTP